MDEYAKLLDSDLQVYCKLLKYVKGKRKTLNDPSYKPDFREIHPMLCALVEKIIEERGPSLDSTVMNILFHSERCGGDSDLRCKPGQGCESVVHGGSYKVRKEWPGYMNSHPENGLKVITLRDALTAQYGTYDHVQIGQQKREVSGFKHTLGDPNSRSIFYLTENSLKDALKRLTNSKTSVTIDCQELMSQL